VLLEMYILPVIGSGADADNGMAHLVSFIHSFVKLAHHEQRLTTQTDEGTQPTHACMHGSWPTNI